MQCPGNTMCKRTNMPTNKHQIVIVLYWVRIWQLTSHITIIVELPVESLSFLLILFLVKSVAKLYSYGLSEDDFLFVQPAAFSPSPTSNIGFLVHHIFRHQVPFPLDGLLYFGIYSSSFYFGASNLGTRAWSCVPFQSYELQTVPIVAKPVTTVPCQQQSKPMAAQSSLLFLAFPIAQPKLTAGFQRILL